MFRKLQFAFHTNVKSNFVQADNFQGELAFEGRIVYNSLECFGERGLVLTMERFSLSDIRKKNCADVYRLVYQEKRVSKQQIANALQMSLPTVAQHLASLEDKGLVEKHGQLPSGIGRKAAAFVPCLSAWVAIGVEVLEREAILVLLDLDGTVLQEQTIALPFSIDEDYFERLSDAVAAFWRRSGIPEDRVLGVGIGMQGLVSKDGKRMTYGEILGCTGLEITPLAERLPFPCRFFHDSECAAELEIWRQPGLTDALYLFLGHHVGSSIIMDGRIYSGRTGRTGNVEHMTIVEDGRPCYCGNRGCLESYCAADVLLGDEPPGAFFEALRQGSAYHSGKWTEFLGWLARAINDVHMLLDSPVVLGGYLAPYLTEADLELLFSLVQSRAAFTEEENYLRIGIPEKNVVAVGAALPYVRDFLDTL